MKLPPMDVKLRKKAVVSKLSLRGVTLKLPFRADTVMGMVMLVQFLELDETSRAVRLVATSAAGEAKVSKRMPV